MPAAHIEFMTSKRLYFAAPPDLASAITQEATRLSMSRSTYIRLVLTGVLSPPPAATGEQADAVTPAPEDGDEAPLPTAQSDTPAYDPDEDAF